MCAVENLEVHLFACPVSQRVNTLLTDLPPQDTLHRKFDCRFHDELLPLFIGDVNDSRQSLHFVFAPLGYGFGIMAMLLQQFMIQLSRVPLTRCCSEESNRHDDLNNMYGWFQKLFKERTSSSARHERNVKVTGGTTQPSSTTSHSASSSSSSTRTSPSKPQKPTSVLSSPQRLRLKYDLLVCHSDADSDIEEAKRLVSFLEASPCSLRCFLWQRDVCVGGAVFTEFCQAVQESHMQALLITPNFLQEEWCKYMMHQALSEGPMSNRLIPLLHNVSHSQYPQELKFYIYINLTTNSDRGYNLINRTVLKYLEDLVKNEKTHDCSMGSSSTGGEGSSREDELIPNNENPIGSDAQERQEH